MGRTRSVFFRPPETIEIIPLRLCASDPEPTLVSGRGCVGANDRAVPVRGLTLGFAMALPLGNQVFALRGSEVAVEMKK